MLAQLERDFPNDLQVVYRHFPLASIHDKALLAAQAAEAAGLQDKFWNMHDFLFIKFNEWTPLSLEDFQTWLIDNVAIIDIDPDQFQEDLFSDAVVGKAQDAWETGRQFLGGTPFIAVDGYPYFGTFGGQSFEGDISYLNLKRLVALEAIKTKQFTICPPMTIDPLEQYIATIQTEHGDIVVELYPDVAPLAVNSFKYLAEHGWYDGVTFHRVIPGFMAQTGDPTGTGIGGPGYAFRDEISPDLSFDSRGILAMANSGPDTNGSQFFITLAPATHLDGGYTIFGRVIEGLDVLSLISPRDSDNNPTLPPGDKIITIVVEEK